MKEFPISTMNESIPILILLLNHRPQGEKKCWFSVTIVRFNGSINDAAIDSHAQFDRSTQRAADVIRGSSANLPHTGGHVSTLPPSGP